MTSPPIIADLADRSSPVGKQATIKQILIGKFWKLQARVMYQSLGAGNAATVSIEAALNAPGCLSYSTIDSEQRAIQVSMGNILFFSDGDHLLAVMMLHYLDLPYLGKHSIPYPL
jgi:hypothetical protein